MKLLTLKIQNFRGLKGDENIIEMKPKLLNTKQLKLEF